MLVRRIARPLLSTFFIAGGIDALRDPAQRAAKAAPLIDKAKASPLVDKSIAGLPGAIAQKLPAEPLALVKINAAIQIGGGVLLASGRAPRLASLALAGSLVPTTLASHDFWNETDPSSRAMQRASFLKNVSLLGGLIIAAVDTEGKPSLGWRGRRAAKKAQASISAALPLVSTHDHTSDRVEQALAVASERGSELVEAAKTHGTEWLELAKDRGSDFAGIAGKRAAEVSEVAKEHWPDIRKAAQKRGYELAEAARERGIELAESASKRSGELAELAFEKSNEWTETASERAEVLGKRARRYAETALEGVAAQTK